MKWSSAVSSRALSKCVAIRPSPSERLGSSPWPGDERETVANSGSLGHGVEKNIVRFRG